MLIIIFKTTSLLSDLNGEKVAIADCLTPPPTPPPPKKNKQTNKKQPNPHICVISIVNFN